MIVVSRGQAEAADALLVLFDTGVLVAHDKRVAGVDRVIQARSDRGARLWRQHPLIYVLHVKVVIEDGGENECVFVNRAALEVEAERGFLFLHGPAQVHAEKSLLIGRPLRLREQRTARVERLLVVLQKHLSADEVASGLG